jgi:hypothetical protein
VLLYTLQRTDTAVSLLYALHDVYVWYRFIGELYKVGLLKEKFVHYSFDDLLPQDQVCLTLLVIHIL